jgi:hypothetical protein
MSIDSNIRKTIEQGNAEVAKGKSASSNTVNALISTLAAYLANADLSSGEKSTMQSLKQRLEALKKS